MSSQVYEKSVKQRNRGKKLAANISLAMSYLLVLTLFVSAALNDPPRAALILVFGLLVCGAIFLLTKKYFSVEYEYSFSYGRMEVSKIYGGRKRKSLAEFEIKRAVLIAPATEENIMRAEHFCIEKRIISVSSERAENIWLIVNGEEDERRVLVFFEADERSLGMLKAINSQAFVKTAG